MLVAKKKRELPKIFSRFIKIGCGCIGIIIIVILLLAIFAGIFIKKLISTRNFQKVSIVQTTTPSSPGQTFIDPSSGSTINLGVNKIPDNFPKDFPIYPKSTVAVSEMSNASSLNGEGFWLTLTTNDYSSKVIDFYQNELEANGWMTGSLIEDNKNAIISKGNLSGYIIIQKTKENTSIVIILGEVKTKN